MQASSQIDTDRDPRESGGWRLRWIERRNRLLGSAAFQRWAARFPLTRPVARTNARRLFDLVAGFAYAQVLHAAVTSGVIERLAAGPAATPELAGLAELPLAGAERLLKACAALGLAERVGALWVLGPQGAALTGAPGVAAMVRHHGLLYADLADPLSLLRRPPGDARLRGFWDYRPEGGAAAPDYSALMAASQPMVADQLLGAYRLAQHRAVLDVGGGEGAFLLRAAQAAPRARLGLFDLPAVVARARPKLAAAGLGDRFTLHAGSFHADALPTGYDCIVLNRVLHDHDDAPAAAILATIRRALPPAGRLLLCEPMAGPREPVGDAYFGLYLWAMGQGRPRPPAEIISMARSAGFRRARLRATALPAIARLIVAEA